MKRFLGIVLACMMVLSVISYAAPVPVGTVESVKETEIDVTDVFEAEVAEDTAVTTDLSSVKLIAKFSFDNLDEQTLNYTGGDASTFASEYNLPAGFPALKLSFHAAATWSIAYDGDSTTDKCLVATPTSEAWTRWYLKTSDGSAYPDGTYMIKENARMSSGRLLLPGTA